MSTIKNSSTLAGNPLDIRVQNIFQFVLQIFSDSFHLRNDHQYNIDAWSKKDIHDK